MGNKESKEITNADTLRNQAVFKNLSNNKSQLQKNDLEVVWSPKIDKILFEAITDVLMPSNKAVNFNDYNEFATSVLRGTYSEKAELLERMLRSIHCGNVQMQLNEFACSLLKSSISLEKKIPSGNIGSWATRDPSESESCQRIADYISRLPGENKTEYTEQDLRLVVSELDRFLVFVLGSLLGQDTVTATFFPRWQRLMADGGRPLHRCSLLTLEDVLFLNFSLPVDWQIEWRLLFSTKIHGESYSRLSGQIVNQGPSLILIEDKSGHIFGGFAPASWQLNPNFTGDSSSFLFTLKPKMNIYPATNYNDNFQYLNQGQQTLPNGLAMGGCHEYFGFWLKSEFGKGISSDSCTTFRNFKRLSKDKEFDCAEVEVWGVGPPPPSAAELGQRSVLDGNSEAKALLELAGRKTYSDGLREAPKD